MLHNDLCSPDLWWKILQAFIKCYLDEQPGTVTGTRYRVWCGPFNPHNLAPVQTQTRPSLQAGGGQWPRCGGTQLVEVKCMCPRAHNWAQSDSSFGHKNSNWPRSEPESFINLRVNTNTLGKSVKEKWKVLSAPTGSRADSTLLEWQELAATREHDRLYLQSAAATKVTTIEKYFLTNRGSSWPFRLDWM